MIDRLKLELGGKCTFLSYLKDKARDKATGEFYERLCLRIILKNETGGKDKLIIPLTEGASFDSVMHLLKNYNNEQGSTNTV